MAENYQSSGGITDPRMATIENYRILAVEVIRKAAEDYIQAYRRALRKKDNMDRKVAEAEYMKIERFFYSDKFMLYSGGILDPETVLDALRRRARKR